MLDDPETAQYTHTLNVTAAGQYTCTVANSVSSASADTTLEGMIHTVCEAHTPYSVFHCAQEPHLPVMWRQSNMVSLASQ